VKDLPTKEYKTDNLKESTANQIRDMTAKCWWMWLEGRQTNMFSTSTLSFANKCFVCYTFSIDKDTSFIPVETFYRSLNDPYFASDLSEKCASGGGGNCMSKCEGDYSKETSSSKCQPDQKCCVADNECESKDGKCAETPPPGTKAFDKWICKSGKTCYVNEATYGTYFDYIQGTKGDGGLGFLVQPDNMATFDSNNYYAITFVSPGNTANWDTLGKAIGTVATAAASVYATVQTIPLSLGVGTNVAAGGTVATAFMYKITQKSGDASANYLYISKYDDVKDKCLAETGAGQK